MSDISDNFKHLAVTPVQTLFISQPKLVNKRNQEGFTPLMNASRRGRDDRVALLLEYGARLEDVHPSTGDTALTLAVQENHLSTCTLLLKHGANCNVLSNGMFPLDSALSMNNLCIFKLLLAHGAQVNSARPDCGTTPLHGAALCGQTDFARLCISHGAEVRARNKLGFTPLHEASQEGWLEIVCVFLSLFLNAFYITYQTKDAHCREMLVAAGASYDDRQCQGAAPIHKAAQKNHTAVVRFLVREAGCPVELVSASL